MALNFSVDISGDTYDLDVSSGPNITLPLRVLNHVPLVYMFNITVKTEFDVPPHIEIEKITYESYPQPACSHGNDKICNRYADWFIRNIAPNGDLLYHF